MALIHFYLCIGVIVYAFSMAYLYYSIKDDEELDCDGKQLIIAVSLVINLLISLLLWPVVVVIIYNHSKRDAEQPSQVKALDSYSSISLVQIQPPLLKIVDVKWTESVNILVIECECGTKILHPADRWIVRCKDCKAYANLKDLRDDYFYRRISEDI